MDKFGIFKLLGSFMDFYAKNKPADEKPNRNGTLGDVFYSILGNRKDYGVKNPLSDDTDKTVPQSPQSPPPLNRAMLDAIKHHDETVNRLRKK